jgi:glutathione S-transferase
LQTGAHPEFDVLKPTLPFGQVPLLTIGAFHLAQSKAIERYVAAKHGLFGANAEEQAHIDAVTEVCVCVWLFDFEFVCNSIVAFGCLSSYSLFA